MPRLISATIWLSACSGSVMRATQWQVEARNVVTKHVLMQAVHNATKSTWMCVCDAPAKICIDNAAGRPPEAKLPISNGNEQIDCCSSDQDLREEDSNLRTTVENCFEQLQAQPWVVQGLFRGLMHEPYLHEQIIELLENQLPEWSPCSCTQSLMTWE